MLLFSVLVLFLAASPEPAVVAHSCFLLQEAGTAKIERGPDEICATRLSPASTFKIPHSLAALDAKVIGGIDAKLAYDGADVPFASWKTDHTLATAMRNSVVWYYQRLAEKLGPEREKDYLRRFAYGNEDTSSGLTNFWLGRSLRITPEEQLAFLRKLFVTDDLPVRPEVRRAVRQILVQPEGKVVNALGEHAFAAPWPAGTTVSTKTGAAQQQDGTSVRWLVGEVRRGGRSWIFVSCVSASEDLPFDAAIALAARRLRETRVLVP